MDFFRGIYHYRFAKTFQYHLMKHKNKMVRLKARQKIYDEKLSRKASCKRPGSTKKSGGTQARHGTSSPQQRSRTAVNAR